MSEFAPLFLTPGDPPVFPDPRGAQRDGLVAVGGDLGVERLLCAYRCGIFPWFDDQTPPLWWSPDPRAVLPAGALHVPRSVSRSARRCGFRLTWDTAFEPVMRACGAGRSDGTWITEAMVGAYTRLFECGDAHSLEVWDGGFLAGGIYGVQVGAVFAAESKFHRRTDASKVALAACVRALFDAGVELIDVQFQTPHLARFGVVEWPRDRYLDRLARLRDEVLDLRGLDPGSGAPGQQ